MSSRRHISPDTASNHVTAISVGAALIAAAVLATTGASPPAAAGETPGTRAQCLRSGEEVVKRTADVLVIRARQPKSDSPHFTCWRQTGRRTAMFGAHHGLGIPGVRSPVGRWVVFFYDRLDEGSGEGTGDNYLGLVDAKSARRYMVAHTSSPPNTFTRGPLLRRTGSVAFVAVGGYVRDRMRISPLPTKALVVCEMPACYRGDPRRGQGTVVDWGPIDPASLRARDGRLLWTKDGAPQSVPFR